MSPEPIVPSDHPEPTAVPVEATSPPPRPEHPDDEEMARTFADEMGWGEFRGDPLGRATFEFVREASAACGAHTVVLDLSADDSRCRPFFRHARYLTVGSRAEETGSSRTKAELIGELSALPIKNEAVDVCLGFRSLQLHARPERAFSEFARVLRPGGELFLCVPCCVPENHEAEDFYRFTRFALARLAATSGLLLRTLRPTNGIYYTTLDLLARTIHTVDDPETAARLTGLKDELAPLLLELDRGRDAAVAYPAPSAIPQWPAAYCLRAAKPGHAIRSRPSGALHDLVQDVAACPQCHGNLIWWNDRSVCPHCSVSYPVVDGRPDLTPPRRRSSR